MEGNIYMSPLKTKTDRKLITHYTEKLSLRWINIRLQLRASMSMTMSHELKWTSTSECREKEAFSKSITIRAVVELCFNWG